MGDAIDRLRRPCIGAATAALAVILLLAATTPGAAASAPQRVLLRTGETIEGRGTVGSFTAAALDIDPTGRLLIGAPLEDGGQVVAWADETGLEVLWQSTAEGPRIQASTARASAGGEHVLALAEPLPYDGGELPHAAVYALRSDGVRRRLAAGDHTADGWQVVAIRLLGGVADDGSAALHADVRPLVGEGIAFRALLALADNGARVVASDSERLPGERRFDLTTALAVLPGGGVVFDARRFTGDEAASGIYRDDGATLSALLTGGDPHPDGGAIATVVGQAASPTGEVLARVCPTDAPLDPFGAPVCPIYRSQAGAWVRVRGSSEPAAGGRLVEVTGRALNRRGDALFDAVWLRDQGGGVPQATAYGAILQPAGGAARILTTDRPIATGPLNEAGETPVTSGVDIARWMPSGRRTLVTRASHTPDGVRLIGGGIANRGCLADDGRVATLVELVDGGRDWLCIDDAGTHRLPPPPTGGESLERCAFAGDEVAVVSGGAVTRIDGRRATAVLRRGDHLPDGGRVDFIQHLAANDAGTVVAAVTTSGRVAVVRQARGDAWEEVGLTTAGAPPPGHLETLSLTPSGRIVALSSSVDQPRSVVVVDPDGARRTLAVDHQVGDTRVILRPVVVRDELALVWTGGHTFGRPEERFIVFDTGTGAVRIDLDAADFAGSEGYLYAIGIGRDGSLLIGESDGFLGGFRHWLVEDGAPQPLEPIDTATYGLAVPIDLASSADVLFRSSQSASGAPHDILATSALRIDGVCPAAAPAGGGSGGGDSGGGCAVAAPRADRAGPLAAGALLLAACGAARRRRARLATAARC